MNTLEILRKIINKNRIEENINITLETSIADDLYLDSLDMYEIILEIEDEFSISIPEEKLDDLDKVQDVVKLIEDLL